MKKGVKVLCAVVALCVVFVLGWRVMPQIWPSIKEAVVYPVFPQMRPEPMATPEPYHPKSDTAFGDPLSKTDSVIYYFYKDYCPYCRQLEPLTAGLPKQIILPDGTASAVKLVCLNKVEEKYLQIITDYYEAYQIPEEEQYVPAMVIGERYLFLGEEIIPELMEALMAGEGLKTPLLDGAERMDDRVRDAVGRPFSFIRACTERAFCGTRKEACAEREDGSFIPVLELTNHPLIPHPPLAAAEKNAPYSTYEPSPYFAYWFSGIMDPAVS